MSQLTLLALLELFGSHCSTTRVAPFPFSPEIRALAAQTPDDPAVYERLAQDAVSQFMLAAPEIEYEKFGCFEESLRILLFYDGRSFRGLVALADQAYTHPDISNAGVNALAWLANFVRARRYPIRAADLQLLKEKASLYTANRTLAHNAQACLLAIQERSVETGQ